MDLMHDTGHLKSLQSFAFTFWALDPYKHLWDLPLNPVIYIWKEDIGIPLSSKPKYCFSIIIMTSLTQREITDSASRAQLKTKTTHWKMRKKVKYLLVFHPVCSCIIREIASKRILWQIIVTATFPWIYRVGRDLWNSSSSPPFPRQLSMAVIPDTSLHKLLLNLPVIKAPYLP